MTIGHGWCPREPIPKIKLPDFPWRGRVTRATRIHRSTGTFIDLAEGDPVRVTGCAINAIITESMIEFRVARPRWHAESLDADT
jgi:hypothetical protein